MIVAVMRITPKMARPAIPNLARTDRLVFSCCEIPALNPGSSELLLAFLINVEFPLVLTLVALSFEGPLLDWISVDVLKLELEPICEASQAVMLKLV